MNYKKTPQWKKWPLNVSTLLRLRFYKNKSCQCSNLFVKFFDICEKMSLQTVRSNPHKRNISIENWCYQFSKTLIWSQCDQILQNFATLAIFKRLRQYFWVCVEYLAKFEAEFGKKISWGHFQRCKWPNIEQINKPSGHTVWSVRYHSYLLITLDWL